MENLLSDLLTDEQYEKIKPFLNELAIRDYNIQKKYKKLRAQKISSGNAIDTLREEYPYLQWDTLRKIAVSVPRKFN